MKIFGSVFMTCRLLSEGREDSRIGIVGESVFTFRREIVKEDMPGDALGIAIEAISIAGILQMNRKSEAWCFTNIRPASMNQSTMMHAEFSPTEGHGNLSDGSMIGEPTF